MADLNQIPGDPEVWLVDGKAYVVYVYDFKNVDGELPVAYEITSAELKAAFGDKPVSYDKKMDNARFDKTGALNFGSAHGLATFEHDPMTEWEDNFRNEAKVRPWLRDGEVASIYLGAYLEGREPTDAEFEGTNWWRTHNAEQRQWLLLYESDPTTAAKLKQDNKLMVSEALRSSGSAGAGPELVDYLTNQYTRGNWSQDYLENQIRHISDPYTPGKMDKGLKRFLDGETPDTTRKEEDTVTELAHQWLGPMHGSLSKEELRRWAGKLRNDPDAEIAFTEQLKKRRMALFPTYDDKEMSYDDIAGTWRQDWQTTLGELPNEAKDKRWIQYLRMNDVEKGGEYLRQTGIERGSDSVSNDALRDTLQAFGTTRRPV